MENLKNFTDGNTEEALKGLSILVTRPKLQSEDLARNIQHHGGEAIIFPTIEIKPTAISQDLLATIRKLDQFKFAIFTSYYTVINSIPLVKRYWQKLPETLAIVAIGSATAKALKTFAIEVDLCPQNNFSSEALLELTPLKNLDDEKIILFRGQGGRQLLATQLRQRGAHLTEYICYHRVMAKPNPQDWKKITHHKIDVIICTSVESLNNLFKLIAEQKIKELNQQWLKHAHWLFISERVKNAGLNFGIKNKSMVANNSSNLEIVNRLIKFAKEKT